MFLTFKKTLSRLNGIHSNQTFWGWVFGPKLSMLGMFPPGRHGNGFVVYFPTRTLQLQNYRCREIYNRQPMDGIWLPGIAKISQLSSPPKTKPNGTQRKTTGFLEAPTPVKSFSLPGASPERPNFREQMHPGRVWRAAGCGWGWIYHLPVTTQDAIACCHHDAHYMFKGDSELNLHLSLLLGRR